MIHYRKIPTQARSLALVEAIIDAAARILVEQGREQVNTNQIAETAGVSIGSLYQYFDNREAILAALAHRHNRRIHDCVAAAFAPAPRDMDKAIAAIAAAIFTAHRMDPALHHALDHDLGHIGHDEPVGTKPVAQTLLMGLPAAVWPGVGAADAPRQAMVASEIIHNLAHVALHHGDWTLEVEARRAARAYLDAAAVNAEALSRTEGPCTWRSALAAGLAAKSKA